jgi:acetyl esterase/lipase
VVLLVVWVVVATTVRRLVRGPKHPTWSYRIELVTEVVRAVMLLGHRYMAIDLRRQMPTLPLSAGLRRRLDWQRGSIAGLPMEQHTPNAWQPGGLVWLHLHGGAYSMCSPATHRGLAARIALGTGARCIVLDYRKAPEHPYPAAIDDAFAAYGALLAEGVDPSAILLGGDSAGGGLALQGGFTQATVGDGDTSIRYQLGQLGCALVQALDAVVHEEHLSTARELAHAGDRHLQGARAGRVARAGHESAERARAQAFP